MRKSHKGARAEGKIRVIAGELRGREILSPRLADTHPMGARAKNALFNMLAEVTGLRVLDAYAGTGALGIEALSRGAVHVDFVEKNARVAQVLQQNLTTLELTVVGRLWTLSVQQFLAQNPQMRFDLIFADPPYDAFFAQGGVIAEIAALAERLVPGGILALSHPGVAFNLPGVTWVKTRQHAGARISLYRK